jgi:hypothetical protein
MFYDCLTAFMKEKFTLRSRLRVEGVFWDATRPDDKFSGTLSCDGEHLELVTRAELVRPEPSQIFGSEQSPPPEVVHGFTSIGECTLIGFQEIGNPGLLDLGTGAGVRWHNFRVTGACLTGWHLPSDTEEVLTSADLTYSGINEWLPGTGGFSFTDDAVTVSFPRKRPTLVDVCVLSKRSRISIKIDPNFQMRAAGKGYTSRSEPVITLEPVEPKSLAWFVDALHRFENLFSLCLGTSVRAKTLHLIGKSEKTESGWLIRPRGGKAEKPYLPIWVRGDSSQLASAISAWFSTPEEFLPLENLIYGTIRHSSLFVETEFLSLAQALESLHRLTDNSTVVERTVFKKALKALCRLISQICGDSPLANRLLDGVRYANEPTFHTRMQSLCSRVNPEVLNKLIGDPALFERQLRQTRNHFTHAGIPKKKDVLTDGKQLFLFNQKLHVLLRLLMLKSIGFTDQAVFDQMFQQSRRYA